MNKILWALAIVFGFSGNLVAEILDDASYDKALQQLLNELSIQDSPSQAEQKANSSTISNQVSSKEILARPLDDKILDQKLSTKSNDEKKKMDGGPFLGVGLGIGPQWERSDFQLDGRSPKYSYQSTMLNLKAGYLLQVNRFVGIRGYVSLDKDIANTQKSPEYDKLKQSLRMLTANLELMLQIPFRNNAIGVFSGFGYGHIKYTDNFFYRDGQGNYDAGNLPYGNRYSGYFPETTNGFSGTVNVGVYLKIGNHMLELDMKRLPLQNIESMSYGYVGSYYDGGKEKFYGILYNVAYSYKF